MCRRDNTFFQGGEDNVEERSGYGPSPVLVDISTHGFRSTVSQNRKHQTVQRRSKLHVAARVSQVPDAPANRPVAHLW